MQPRPVVLCDLDGCIAELWGTVNDWRIRDGLPLISMPQDFEESNLTEFDRRYLGRIFGNPLFYRNMRPTYHAKWAMWELYRKYDICYVTARGTSTDGRGDLVVNPGIRYFTNEWLFNWEMPPGPLLFTEMHNKATCAQMTYDKELIAFAIEDNAQATMQYIDAGIFVYMVTYPYNIHIPEDTKRVMVVDNLKEVIWDRQIRDRIDSFERGERGDRNDKCGEECDTGDCNNCSDPFKYGVGGGSLDAPEW